MLCCSSVKRLLHSELPAFALWDRVSDHHTDCILADKDRNLVHVAAGQPAARAPPETRPWPGPAGYGPSRGHAAAARRPSTPLVAQQRVLPAGRGVAKVNRPRLLRTPGEAGQMGWFGTQFSVGAGSCSPFSPCVGSASCHPLLAGRPGGALFLSPHAEAQQLAGERVHF